jgi:hypothetical protein
LDCTKQFQSKRRPKRLEQIIWQKYVHERRTIKNLAKDYDRGANWVRNKIRQSDIKEKTAIGPQGLVFVADVTFFGQAYGFMVFRSPKLKRNLYYKLIPYETTFEYQLGRTAIEDQGFKIKAIVLDGKPGVRNLFLDIPVQMCHFHQKKIIQRYLTLNPILEAGIELKKITNTLCYTYETEFTQKLEKWHKRWEAFLKERTIDPITNRWHYTHRRVRSAYYSLKKNLPYLFTYQKHPELNIPNTTNSLDGSFAHLKELVGVHRGHNQYLKKKIIEEILGK